MKKLMLSLDDLRVDTFSTTAGPKERQGTVQANEFTYTCGFSCGPDTYFDTCPVTGMDSCGETACSCSDVYETCAQMGCPLSHHTDCHRC